jgi:TRAP-type uncharacterized transport system substrate-binding protein
MATPAWGRYHQPLMSGPPNLVNRAVPRERFQRVLGLPSRALGAPAVLKALFLVAVLGLVAVLVGLSDHTPNLSHLRIGFLSGGERGNYYAIVSALAAEAARQNGRIENLTSAGSVENVSRLIATRPACNVHFALVQDGMQWPAGHQLELVGRLSKAESLVFLGRDADRITSLSGLRGKRIGVGPVGSGTERVARQVLAPLGELGMILSPHALDEQFAMLEAGELDLGAMVIDEDARLLREAVRDRKLQILDLPAAEALARTLPFTHVGRIAAGQYDPIRSFPPGDRRVLRIDTLIVGNGCARRSTTQGLITALAAVMPDFARYNRESPNRTGLRFAPAARSYFDNDGPDLLGVYAPWLLDIMPMVGWIQLFFGISLLLNATSLWHRFRLWRIDANRVRAEASILPLFGPGVTVGEIAEMPPSETHQTQAGRAEIDKVVERLAWLSERCRRQSMSMLVPMGQEMAYRYQEALIADLLYALRSYRGRFGPASGTPPRD